MLLALTLLLSPQVHAQDAIDAHGFNLVPHDGDGKDLLTTWRPEEQVRGSFSVSGLFEYADDPLVQFSYDDDDEVVREALLDNLFGFNLSAAVGLHERIGVGLTLPLWFTSSGLDGAEGLAVGDIRLAVPVGLVVPDMDEGGFGFSFVPFFDIPAGASDRFLGNSGPAGGAVVAVGYGGSAWEVDANAGFLAAPTVDFQNIEGGARVLASLGGAVMLDDHHAVRLEGTYKPSFTAGSILGAESPAEVLLSGRGNYDNGLSWTLGGASALTPGASAARFRVFLGVGFTYGKVEVDRDRDGDLIFDSVDACRDEPEVVNEYKDDDGCPDQLATVKIRVVDQDGEPVAKAKVKADGERAVTVGSGVATYEGRMPESAVGLEVSHEWFAVPDEQNIQLVEGVNEATFTLEYLPGRITVVARDQEGNPVDAKIRMEGPATFKPEHIGPDGEQTFTVRPGDWMVLASADDFGTDRSDVTLKPGQDSELVVEFSLKPAKVEVVREEIDILEKVYFDFDKATIRSDSLPLLREVANVILDNPEITSIEIAGHTDVQGDDEYNRELSQRRVDSVRQFLIDQGVKPGVLVAKGYGESKPVTSGTSDADHAKNRRVEFHILEQGGN